MYSAQSALIFRMPSFTSTVSGAIASRSPSFRWSAIMEIRCKLARRPSPIWASWA